MSGEYSGAAARLIQNGTLDGRHRGALADLITALATSMGAKEPVPQNVREAYSRFVVLAATGPLVVMVEWAEGAILEAGNRAAAAVRAMTDSDDAIPVRSSNNAHSGAALVIGDQVLTATDLACLSDVARAVLAQNGGARHGLN